MCATNSQQDRDRRFAALLDVAESEMPEDDARHGDWLSFARIWAEVNLLASEVGAGSAPDVAARVISVRTQVDSRFSQWLQRQFGSLYSLPASPPVMVHHIARFLSMHRDGTGKVALIVVDGLAFDQWLVVQHEISQQRPCVAIRRKRNVRVGANHHVCIAAVNLCREGAALFSIEHLLHRQGGEPLAAVLG